MKNSNAIRTYSFLTFTLFLVLAANSGAAPAAPIWVSGKPWKTRVFVDYKVQVNAVESRVSLSSSCSLFTETMNKLARLPIQIRRDQFNNLRMIGTGGFNPRNKFSIDIPLSLPPDHNLLSNDQKTTLVTSNLEAVLNSPLPYSVFAPDAVRLDFPLRSSIDFTGGDLSTLGTQLGVEKGILEIINKGTDLFLRISTLDLACDLSFSRDFALLISAKASAFISFNDQVKLRNFYGKVADITNPILESTQSPKRRAVSIGYQIGRLLDLEFPLNNLDRNQNALFEMVSLLFEEKTLEPGSAWNSSIKSIDLSGESEFFNIDLKIQNN